MGSENTQGIGIPEGGEELRRLVGILQGDFPATREERAAARARYSELMRGRRELSSVEFFDMVGQIQNFAVESDDE